MLPLNGYAVDEHTMVRFTLPMVSAVSLNVFDVQGRRMTSVYERQVLAAGAHDVRMRTAEWPAGCYFYRLEVGGERLTRKMVVLK